MSLDVGGHSFHKVPYSQPSKEDFLTLSECGQTYQFDSIMLGYFLKEDEQPIP
jgi:hypothetical protein